MAGSGNAGSLWVKLGVNSKSFDKGLKEAESKLKKMGDTFANVGQKLTIGLSLPLALISGAALKLGMDAVESENLFSISMGKMASSARKWSEDLRKNLGLNSYEVRKNVGTFNVMLTSMGLNEKAAFDMSKGLTQLAYDMASFYNLKPEEAFQKLQSGISGESEPLKRLGILVNETTTKNYALTHGMLKQGEQLSETGKVAARYGTIMEATSKAQGDMSRTLDSPANKMRILQARIQQITIDLGTALLPAFQSLMTAFQPLIQMLSNVASWFNKLNPNIQKFVGYLIAFAIAIGPVTKGIGLLSSGTTGLVASFAPFLAGGPIIAGLMAVIGCFETLQKYHNLANANISKITDTAKLNAEAKYWDEQLKKRKDELSKYSQGPNTGDKETDRLLREHNKLLSGGTLSNPRSEDLRKKQLEAAVKEAENKVKQIKQQQEKASKPPASPKYEPSKISGAVEPKVKPAKAGKTERTSADIIKDYDKALTEIKNKEAAMTSLFDEPAAKADLLLSKIQELSAIDPTNKVLKGWITDYETITGNIETAKKLEEERIEQEKKITEELKKQNEEREDAISFMQELADAAEAVGQPEELQSDKTWNEQIKKLNEKFYVQQAMTQEEYNNSRANIDKVWAANHEKEATDAWQSELEKYTDLITKQMQLDKDLTNEQKKQVEQRLANRLLELDPNTPEYDATLDIYKNLGMSNLASSDNFAARWQIGLSEGIKNLESFGDTVQQMASSIASGMSSAFETEFFNIFQGEYSNLKEMFSGLEDVVADFLNSITQNIAKMLANMATQQLMSLITGGTTSSTSSFLASLLPSIGAFASGGSVTGNKTILVGEKGPELFVPSSSGNIISNSQLSDMNQRSGSSSSGNVSVNVINSTGTQATAKVTSKKSDSVGNQAITVVMEAVRKNTGGSRDFFRSLGNS